IRHMRADGKSSNRGLATQVMWPTPTARDWKDGTAASCANVPENCLLGRAVHTREQQTQVGGSLNPTWVEWLMGYPLGWTDCEHSGTASSPRSPNGSAARSSNGNDDSPSAPLSPIEEVQTMSEMPYKPITNGCDLCGRSAPL